MCTVAAAGKPQSHSLRNCALEGAAISYRSEGCALRKASRVKSER